MTDPSTASGAPSNAAFSQLLARLPSRITWKALAIGVLGLALLIPLGLIHAIVWERQARYDEAARSIAESWGAAQRIAGPALTMSYEIVNERPDAKEPPRRETIALLPDRLRFDARLRVEQRARGLFAVNVYSADVVLEGDFVLADLVARLGKHRPDWATAELRLGIADLRSIQVNDATVGGMPVSFDAAGEERLLGNGVKAMLPAPLDPQTTPRLPFRLAFSAKGSQALSFVPLARETEAAVAANWDSPSFTGAQLPASWKRQDDGFVAAWKIGHLGRGMPQAVTEAESAAARKAMSTNMVSVDLVTPVSSYRLVERAIKYGVLFVALTFAVFLLAERLGGHVLHVVQYALVGFALCLFFVLLLALAEHMGFAAAYLGSAAAIVAQTGLYVRAAVRDWRPAAIHAAMIAGLYACLYALLQLEDRALLVGAGFLFLVLSALMYATRGLGQRDSA